MLLKAELFWLVCVLFRFYYFVSIALLACFFLGWYTTSWFPKPLLGFFSLSSREGVKFESILNPKASLGMSKIRFVCALFLLFNSKC
jgi:hypothetical protein